MISHDQLIPFYLAERRKTEQLCQPLAIEDYVVQTIEDVSPPKWHLAHTSWFFETFLLIPYLKKYQLFDRLFQYLFNSYYHQVGKFFPRLQRGSLSRPTVETIYIYRRYVDKHVCDLLSVLTKEEFNQIELIITLGLQHEQQHQELLMMDVKHNFSINLDSPIYQTEQKKYVESKNILPLKWIAVRGGVVEVGHSGKDFCFDNELPRHSVILNPYAISSRLINNAEYCEFIEAGGYSHAKWWLSDGWDCVQKNNWQAPLYWQRIDNEWHSFTLQGLKKINPSEPVCHVSYYEADAYARWRGMRLPTETEWEHFVLTQNLNSVDGNFLESDYLHPKMPINSEFPTQFFGDLWEWTASSYSPYPGYQPLSGALSEYNGKFMSNQMVLRGGCCVTPQAHIRSSYRNFFQPEKRWQFSGIRLVNERL